MTSAAEQRRLRARMDALLDQYARPAIVLHRAPAGAINLSKLGGLPTLPDGVDWPLGRVKVDGVWQDTPLHFVAQIDCADGHELDRRLPSQGVLYFFVSLHEEMVWDSVPGEPGCFWKVLYCSDVRLDQPGRGAPSDLLPMQEWWGAEKLSPWVLPGERPPSVSPSAVIELRPTITYPRELYCLKDDEQWVDVVPHEWRDNWDIKRDFARRSAWKNSCEYFLSIERIPNVFSFPFSFSRDNPEQRYFWYYGALVYILRCLVNETSKFSEINGSVHAKLAEVVRFPPLQKLSGDEHRQFSDWIVQLRADADRTSGYAIDSGVLSGARAAAVHGYLCSPFDTLEECFPYPPPLQLREMAEFHQMFGHLPASQGCDTIDDPSIGLLHLMSDKAMEWQFGDAGGLQFWITPEDLAAQQFDRAWAILAGS